MKDVALIFPGQGAQFVGMGAEFVQASEAAKKVFAQAEGVVENLSEVVFTGPAEKLTATAFAQPGIFAMSMAALAALKEHPKFADITPRFTAGLSLGEYSALCASEVLNFEDTLRLVLKRGSFMEEATQLKKGAMAAVIGFDQTQLESICKQVGAEVANYNSPDQIVITGEAEKVEEASAKIKEAGAKRVIALDVSGAFHSSLMQPAADKFAKVLNEFDLQAAAIPLVSNVNGEPAESAEFIRTNLSRQITSSVQWIKTIESIAKEGVETFIEIGPGSVLKGLIRKINRDLKCYNIQKPEDIEKLEL